MIPHSLKLGEIFKSMIQKSQDSARLDLKENLRWYYSSTTSKSLKFSKCAA